MSNINRRMPRNHETNGELRFFDEWIPRVFRFRCTWEFLQMESPAPIAEGETMPLSRDRTPTILWPPGSHSRIRGSKPLQNLTNDDTLTPRGGTSISISVAFWTILGTTFPLSSVRSEPHIWTERVADGLESQDPGHWAKILHPKFQCRQIFRICYR